MPNILSKKTKEFLEIMNDVNLKLNWNVHDNSSFFVEYFVNYQGHVAYALNLIEEKQTELEDLNGLLLLIRDYRIKFNETLKTQIVQANNIMASIKKKIEEASVQYDQNLSKSAKKIEKFEPETYAKLK